MVHDLSSDRSICFKFLWNCNIFLLQDLYFIDILTSPYFSILTSYGTGNEWWVHGYNGIGIFQEKFPSNFLVNFGVFLRGIIYIIPIMVAQQLVAQLLLFLPNACNRT